MTPAARKLRPRDSRQMRTAGQGHERSAQKRVSGIALAYYRSRLAERANAIPTSFS